MELVRANWSTFKKENSQTQINKQIFSIPEAVGEVIDS